MSLDQKFEQAVEAVKTLTKRPTDNEFLELYALYKQATIGNINTGKPGTFDLKGKAKWDAWKSKEGMSSTDAKEAYIKLVDTLIQNSGQRHGEINHHHSSNHLGIYRCEGANRKCAGCRCENYRDQFDNGCALIEAKDDGCGISQTDASRMALPSYTSKISNFSDLDKLQTYGFRGQALYALSSISDLTIVTKMEQDEVATSYSIDRHGRVAKSEPCHRSTGTTVQVKEIFKQTPVRRQIITNSRKASQDVKALESLIRSYSMCRHSVRISFKVDKNVVFAKPSAATFQEAVTYIIGKKVTRNMSWIDVTDADVDMKIMVPSKEAENAQDAFHSGSQYIFVNNRPIRCKELERVVTKTISEALREESSSKRKPIFVLYILVNAADVDVNLEPNKTSIFLKEQDTIASTIQKRLEQFYGIQREEQEEISCDNSFANYQDYTQQMNINDAETEVPACKKRKLQAEEVVEKPSKRSPNEDNDAASDLRSGEVNACSTLQQQAKASTSRQSCQQQTAEGCLDVRLPFLNLSDSDSNDSQNFNLVCKDSDASNDSAKKNAEAKMDDSPPLQFSQHYETFSQLPVVDLGDDFEYDEYLEADASEKENRMPNAEAQVAHMQDKSKAKPATLDEWSKGHVSGLKGGTDVKPYNNFATSESSNLCEGFLKFSSRIRSEVTEQNPTLTAPQIAQVVTSLWKKLTPEERGYYRDVARDEKLQHDAEKRQAKEERAAEIDRNRNKNRLFKALEKMKTTGKKGENLVMRTTVPWNIDLSKITESFSSSASCKNGSRIVGPLHSNLWIVRKSGHIWILDAGKLKKELQVSDADADEDDAKNVEDLLEKWFSAKDDLSLLHPIHSLAQTTGSP